MSSRQKQEGKNLRENSIWVTLGDNILDIFASSSARPQIMSYCARKRSIAREVWVDVNRIEIAGNIQVRLVGERRIENGGAFRGCQSVAFIGQSSQLTLSNAMMLHVCNDGIAFTVILLEINCSDLDEPLELIVEVVSTRRPIQTTLSTVIHPQQHHLEAG